MQESYREKFVNCSPYICTLPCSPSKPNYRIVHVPHSISPTAISIIIDFHQPRFAILSSHHNSPLLRSLPKSSWRAKITFCSRNRYGVHIRTSRLAAGPPASYPTGTHFQSLASEHPIIIRAPTTLCRTYTRSRPIHNALDSRRFSIWSPYQPRSN